MCQRKFVEKIKIHNLYPVTFFENGTFYEITWKNIVEQGRPRMTIWRMCIACLIPKVIKTLSLLTLIAFLLQQWLRECDSLLRYTYIASHV